MIEPIVVVGPGRCGTSCVAGVLHHLGVFMGERMVGAHATNPYGHWEDCEFLELNVPRLAGRLSPQAWADAVQRLIEKRRALQRPWGWKDPRTCNLLHDYLEFFNAPKFIRCVRDPDEIETSVVKAYGGNGWTREEAHAMRLKREQGLDQYLPWYETLEVNFDRLRSDREAVVLAIVEFCGLRRGNGDGDVTDAKIRAAVSFIRPAGPVGDDDSGGADQHAPPVAVSRDVQCRRAESRRDRMEAGKGRRNGRSAPV